MSRALLDRSPYTVVLILKKSAMNQRLIMQQPEVPHFVVMARSDFFSCVRQQVAVCFLCLAFPSLTESEISSHVALLSARETATRGARSNPSASAPTVVLAKIIATSCILYWSSRPAHTFTSLSQSNQLLSGENAESEVYDPSVVNLHTGDYVL